ncbi:hypothetical protein ACFX19_034284 [Malus domestica]
MLLGILSFAETLLTEAISEASEASREAMLMAMSWGGYDLNVTKDWQDLTLASQRYPFDMAGLLEQLNCVLLRYAC